MIRRIPVVTALFLVGIAAATAQTQLPWYVVGSGGQIGAVSGQRLLSGTIGQVVIGTVSTTGGSRLSQGFWLPLSDTTVSVNENPADYSLATDVRNYPNPFSAATTIRFDNPVEGTVIVRVFDLTGNLVRTLTAELSLAGGQEILFDGQTDSGAPLGSGTYLYEVRGTGLDGRPLLRVQRMTIVR